ncbi:hypothetical protein P8Q88_08390 [Qipengyuania sp. XHP0207]|uniref:hypothetical protein n=1 Tax=Qipengyuania sp. XHP0207 TaxID=3038078 RepID=UPI00241E3FD7|nr:hypothetical protein [Qipengyuania sp. XHP0207]MDG5748198.1 hypothetical protein [Qipengyuania sp. XHP0207]
MYRSALFASLAFAAALAAVPSAAQEPTSPALTYADIVDLADTAPLVVRAEIRDQATVEPERSPGLEPGHVRLYVEARTTALIAGTAPVGESLRYLVDLPLTEKGKAPKLKKQDVLLFARPVPSSPGTIQLVEPDAQFAYSEPFADSVRSVLASLLSPTAPPRVTGVRDALAVEGTLVGESETQLFLDTEQDGPVSVTVVRRPDQAPRWGVSWTEIVDQAARPPRRETIEWYRLACFLPESLPGEANLSTDPRARQLAERDYALVLEQLGDCPRTRS